MDKQLLEQPVLICHTEYMNNMFVLNEPIALVWKKEYNEWAYEDCSHTILLSKFLSLPQFRLANQESVIEKEAEDYATRYAGHPIDKYHDRHLYKEAYTHFIAGATSSSTLLNFCHWIGKKGYKINGYDDGQLMTIINQFKTENNL